MTLVDEVKLRLANPHLSGGRNYGLVVEYVSPSLGFQALYWESQWREKIADDLFHVLYLWSKN